ncbi:MAG: PDZ domain-containing protein [Oscillospiraceae bacterium]|nr:PDZ domain-containing protein [Oscillospiraceae bacterium]
MQKFSKWLSYVLVAVIASCVTLFLCTCLGVPGSTKLQQLENLILDRYIGEAERDAMEDAAAEAMVNAIGDRWSFYMTAAEYQDYQEQMANAYVGVGVTISVREDGHGFDVMQVTKNGPAQEAGVQAGDIITGIDGKVVSQIGTDAAREMIRGEAGTQVKLTVVRGEDTHTLTVTRRSIQMPVATATLLPDRIGLVTIENFDSRCAEETTAAIEDLRKQGAEALIFDVRYNPGGYVDELVKVLDYLLPEGDLFRSEDYKGRTEVRKSDADHLDMPMAVLVNGSSYSAAEFFAAALKEYDAAMIVGEPTTGKGYFQQTYRLSDGSAVNLSVGKYYTPKGVSLADVGGLIPDMGEKLNEEMDAKLYADILDPAEDPHIQAAANALKSK